MPTAPQSELASCTLSEYWLAPQPVCWPIPGLNTFCCMQGYRYDFSIGVLRPVNLCSYTGESKNEKWIILPIMCCKDAITQNQTSVCLLLRFISKMNNANCWTKWTGVMYLISGLACSTTCVLTDTRFGYFLLYAGLQVWLFHWCFTPSQTLQLYRGKQEWKVNNIAHHVL